MRFVNAHNYIIVPEQIKLKARTYCIFNINKIKLIFFFIILCYVNESFSQRHGTVLIGVIRNDTIWIGADSKASGDGTVSDTFVCKILRFNDFVISHSGLYTSGKFNVDELITNIASRVNNFYAMMDTIDKYILYWFSQWGDYAISKGNIGNWMGNTIDTTTIIFAKFIDDNPIIFYHIFVTKAITSDNIHYKAKTTLDTVSSPIAKEIFFGYWGGDIMFRPMRQRIQNGKETIDNLIGTKNIPPFINDLIITEMKINWTVDKPISIIRLTKDSIEWEEGYKALCEP